MKVNNGLQAAAGLTLGRNPSVTPGQEPAERQSWPGNGEEQKNLFLTTSSSIPRKKAYSK